jgi:putative hydrolase of the HAD superfamily
MNKAFDVIAFDADDTLWHNEVVFSMTQAKFQELLGKYPGVDTSLDLLHATEIRNLKEFGYGIKGFALSMIEAAIEMTKGQIVGHDIQQIVDFAREMINTPLALLDHVAELIPALSEEYPLMIITKGDLVDQETKIAHSGLADYFEYIEIVSDKKPETYAQILRRNQIDPQRFIMIGNSLRSDILPVLDIGASAVHIPYHVTWAHEVVDTPVGRERFYQLEHVGQFRDFLANLSK